MTVFGLRLRAWPLLFAGIALVYVYFFPYFPALNNPNENSRVYQIRAAVELHKLGVNEQIARYGMVNDLGKRDGIFYPAKAPATTFLGVPIYAALRSIDAAQGHPSVSTSRLIYALRLAGTILPTLAFVLVFRRFLRRYVSDKPIADALSAALALGSMLLPYALIYVNHSLSAVTAFGAVIATEAGARALDRSSPSLPSASLPSRRFSGLAWLGLTGFLIAMSAALDYALLPVSLALLVYASLKIGKRPLGFLSMVLGAAPPSIATAAHHTICWGGPFRLPTSFIVTPEFAANHAKGLFGIVGMTRASIEGVLVSPSKGILYFSPVFGLAIIASIAACRRSRSSRGRGLAFLCAGITLWMIVYTVSLINWHAGWTVGPRYMTVIVPFALFSMGLSWQSLRPRTRAALLPLGVGLTIASVLFITMTSVLFPHPPPDYTNPVFELIWPLWRDGITPHNLGRSLFGWTGRAAQAPFLAALAAILLYFLWIGSGSFLRPRPGVLQRVGSSITAVLVAALFLYGASIPRTESKRVVDSATTWVRKTVWSPPVAAR